MNWRRGLFLLLVFAVLALLIYLQFRAWQTFDWSAFFRHTREASGWRLLSGVVLVYFGYFLRAVRWKVFLRPVKATSARALFAPMLIGFTGLAVLGRPGELLRPYVVAKKEGLTFASQMGVWTVERIFDMSTFVLLVATNLVLSPSLQGLPYYQQFTRAGIILAMSVVVLALGAFAVWKKTDEVADFAGSWVGKFSTNGGKRFRRKLKAFGDGLHTINDAKALLQLALLSIAIWLCIAFAYYEVTHAYPEPLASMTLSHLLLLMGFSILGSSLQLPIVGGGSQVMTIAAFAHVFSIPNELAVSCGIMMWLVTFISVVPAGLWLAHREHVSFREGLGGPPDDESDAVTIKA